MSPEQKSEIKSNWTPDAEAYKFESIYDYFAFIQGTFDGTLNSLTVTLTNFFNVENRHNLSDDTIVSLIAKVCLPFLRVASILYHLLYLEPTLPDHSSIASCKSSLDEFTVLTSFLNLSHSNHQQLSSNVESNEKMHFFRPYINWIDRDPTGLITVWYREFDKFVQSTTIASMNLIRESFLITHRPRLLQLPVIYEQLFMFYHKRTCVTCNGVPKDASICLICGRLVCIRENCCRVGSSLEGVTHSKKCGAGTCIYLAINSSSIIVIRGRKACIWGSVYLDEFGEEDRDLKRGKPLFLCKERYRILEQQWLTHSFSHINKKWVYHKESL